MKNRMRGDVCGPGCWPTGSGCDCYDVRSASKGVRSLGFITNQITMSLGEGGQFGFITPKITQMLGQPMPTLVDNQPMPSLVGLGQDPAQDPSAGRTIFSVMLLGLGISLGFAMGVSYGVKVAR